jgi:hypothetical protein
MIQIQKDKLEQFEAYRDTGKFNEGHLYEVEIPDEITDRMLDWDKPLSEQPESVRKALEGIGISVDSKAVDVARTKSDDAFKRWHTLDRR